MATFNPDGTVDSNPNGYIFAERDSPQWDAVWQALIATGRNPKEYMLMHGTPWRGHVEWGFKHTDTRKYIYVTV
ncbi:hypothetical protein LCGC14_0289540 [marine sediment metagenome]|uniref:Uncharacterized protein n=1 Tax=marine sediment metagenome TaxID=412755 RepID=A0A0F9UAU3_9ZZZZ